MDNNKPICESYENGFRWFLNGHLHKEDGPAVELPNKNSDLTKIWILNDHIYSFEGYLKELKKIGKSDEEIFLLNLKYK
jgi:hypothetical protein